MRTKSFKHFDVDENGIISFKGSWSYYWFDQDELKYYYPDGQHRWFPHLASKIFFTEEVFWEMLEYAKTIHPTVNFDKAIYQTTLKFAEASFYENFDYHQMIHQCAEASTVSLDENGKLVYGIPKKNNG